jgi:hypothetical protein
VEARGLAGGQRAAHDALGERDSARASQLLGMPRAVHVTHHVPHPAWRKPVQAISAATVDQCHPPGRVRRCCFTNLINYAQTADFASNV